MVEYIYKGFVLSYTIHRGGEKNAYKAEGCVTYLLNMPQIFEPKKFYTEYTTHVGVEHEIKKLLENYVNFELKNFYDMKKEKKDSKQPNEQVTD